MTAPSIGEVTLAWVAGEHKFNIAKLGLRLALEEKCDAGTQELLQRIIEGRARFNDIRETIRLGLIGGGMPDHEALKLVKLHVDDCPRADNALLARAILLAEIIGIPKDDDQPGKSEADRAATEADSSMTTAASSDPQSTASEPPSGSRQEKSTKSQSGNLPPVSTATTEPTAATASPTP